MPYLIDGNNLIGAIRIIDIRDPGAREKMTSLLARYQQAKNNTVVVVYDGPPPDGAHQRTYLGGLSIIYAGPESDADSEIRRILEESSDPASYTVVSSDKQVYSFARWRGAQAMRVMAFYSDLRKTLERSGRAEIDLDGLPDAEVEEWMRYFGIEHSDGT